MSHLEFRNKPFIVICGCTGTGKTKLSIELAKWLIQKKKKCEIINGDAMQLYKNLDIITNKATIEEMDGVKHHLIGYLDSTCINNHVIDFKNKAVPLIDDLLQNDIIPIFVGGTHYYIQSVIWDILIDKTNDSSYSPKKIDSTNFCDSGSKIVKLIIDSLNETNSSQNRTQDIDLNVKLHDSDVKTEEIYEELVKVDLQSAQKIHPNDRRKLCRALQIYYTFGVPKSHLLDMKNKQIGTNYPLRYKNVCMFVMNCESQTLNKRLDDRVDKMIGMGLFEEIENFKKEFKEIIPNQTFRDYSRNFEFGIFQSIGFKEFDDYFKYIESNESIDETIKSDLFNKAVLDMKLSTRRYAKTQIRWVKNRFIKRSEKNSPLIHELDTTDLDKWNENIFEKATLIFTDYLNRFDLDNNIELNKWHNDEPQQEIFEFNKCDICNKTFVNKFQWECKQKF